MPSHQYTDLCHGATEHVGAFFRALKTATVCASRLARCRVETLPESRNRGECTRCSVIYDDMAELSARVRRRLGLSAPEWSVVELAGDRAALHRRALPVPDAAAVSPAYAVLGFLALWAVLLALAVYLLRRASPAGSGGAGGRRGALGGIGVGRGTTSSAALHEPRRRTRRVRMQRLVTAGGVTDESCLYQVSRRCRVRPPSCR
jgi:hypothetical protein